MPPFYFLKIILYKSVISALLRLCVKFLSLRKMREKWAKMKNQGPGSSFLPIFL